LSVADAADRKMGICLRDIHEARQRACGAQRTRENFAPAWNHKVHVGFTFAAISGVSRMNESQLREKILDVVCENGVDRQSILASQQLAGKIDSLKLLELIEVLEDSISRPIPEEELTEDNFSSVPVILKMVNRLAQGAR
jgi:acyl carrier protein